MNSSAYKTEFESGDQQFLRRVRSLQLFQLVWWPFCFLFFVVLFPALQSDDETNHRYLVSAVMERISNMTSETLIQSIGAGIVITLAVMFLFREYYKRRRIIVELSFDDKTMELTVRSKTVSGKQSADTFKYSDLRLTSEHLSDGMSTKRYDVITLQKKDRYLIGHIFCQHFTWNQEDVEEIKEKLSIIAGPVEKRTDE